MKELDSAEAKAILWYYHKESYRQVFDFMLCEFQGKPYNVHQKIENRAYLERLIIKKGYWANRCHRNTPLFAFAQTQKMPHLHTRLFFEKRIQKRIYLIKNQTKP